MAGTEAASAQAAHGLAMTMPSSLASFMQRRFCAAAVRKRADELTDPWNWAWTRKEPSFLAEGVPVFF